MTRANQSEIRMRIVIDGPVVGVAHSLQSKDGGPLDAQCSKGGEPLAFDLAIRVAPGPKFFGDQVRLEGSERRFVHVRIGQMAGDPASPWPHEDRHSRYRWGHARPRCPRGRYRDPRPRHRQGRHTRLRDAQADVTVDRLAMGRLEGADAGLEDWGRTTGRL